jgi:hypothetical protein
MNNNILQLLETKQEQREYAIDRKRIVEKESLVCVCVCVCRGERESWRSYFFIGLQSSNRY